MKKYVKPKLNYEAFKINQYVMMTCDLNIGIDPGELDMGDVEISDNLFEEYFCQFTGANPNAGNTFNS